MTTPLLPSSGHNTTTSVEDWLRTFPPEAPLVVLLTARVDDDRAQRVRALLDTLPLAVPVLVTIGDGEDAQPELPNEWHAYLGYDLAQIANCASKWADARDIVLLRNGVAVPPEWLPRLRAAAYARSTIATATPFGNASGLLSVPKRNLPTYALPRGMSATQADTHVRHLSGQLYPIIPAPVDGCVYFKRAALDVVGEFDSGQNALEDFSQRAVMHGFCHVAADDLYVFAPQPLTLPEARDGASGIGEESEAPYPWLGFWQRQAARGQQTPLARALDLARMAITGRRIAIDATMLAASGTGMRVVILELIHALATQPGRDAHLTVILGEHAREEYLLGAERHVDAVVNAVSLRRVREPVFDLVHRPAQVHFPDDFTFLRRIARRVVVTQLDFIMYANPSYFPTVGEWSAHRQFIDETHEVADGIAYLSDDARRDAANRGLVVPAERACVMYCGVDHPLMNQHRDSESAEVAPSEFSVPAGLPYLLVLGNNFRHKNRVYATRLFKELAETQHWTGHLVLVGPRIPFGGSEEDEDREAITDNRYAERIHHLGAVSDAGKRWLLRHAALVLYPSIVEGFGLVPFEAAAMGTPALATRGTSIAEMLGDEVRYLETYDPADGARVAWEILAHSEVAARQVAAISSRAAYFTWARVATILWKFYDHMLTMPPRHRAGGYVPEDGGTLADVRRYARVVFSEQLNPHVPRSVQLLQRSAVTIRGEGVSAFLRRLRLWLRGERRYYRRSP